MTQPGDKGGPSTSNEEPRIPVSELRATIAELLIYYCRYKQNVKSEVISMSLARARANLGY